MRLAYFSPLPPQRSGISEYSVELLEHLSPLADVTVFGEPQTKEATRWPSGLSWRPIEQFASQTDAFDLALYHIGNSEFHENISRLALLFPGILVMHDVYLHHSVAKRTIGLGDRNAYWREMGYERGAAGVRQAQAQAHGAQPPLFSFPLISRLLDTSLGVIVHSDFAREVVRRHGFRGPLAVVPALVTELPVSPCRAELAVSDDAVVFGSYGLMTREKGVVETAESIGNLRDQGIDAHYLLVGGALPDVPIERAARSLGPALHRTGFVPSLGKFVDWIGTADVVVNLRNPTAGETSATALRAMAAARPLIVSDHGWYREIPAEAAVKVLPGDTRALAQALRRLANSAQARQDMGQAGLAYVRKRCHPRAVAAAYADALQMMLGAMRIYG